MYNPQSFGDRVAEARAAARFGAIQSQSRNGNKWTVYVPGHKRAEYRILVRKEMIGTQHVLSAECSRVAGVDNFVPCNGNLAGVCYHSIAAFIMITEEADYAASFSKEPESIIALKNVAGDQATWMTALYSWQARKKPIYVLVKSNGTD